MLKDIWKYGLAMALLLAALKFLEYRWWMKDIPLELLVFIYALFFTILGVWMGLKLTRPNNPTADPLPPVDFSVVRESMLLSEREREVLQLLADGRSNEQIAAQLFISINTVKTHLSNVYVKLDAKRRTEAIRKARALCLIKE